MVLKQETAFREIVQRALIEDRVDCDVTTLACIPEESISDAEIVVKEPALICGLPLIATIFAQLGAEVDLQLLVSEGSWVAKGAVIAKLIGKTRTILSAERVMLNLVQLATSVATKTARYVKEAPGCDILDTRKTLPGLRALQKYAVRIGGGVNHRNDLEERVLIKDNHLAHVSIAEAVAAARGKVVEVEVDTLEQLEEALKARPNAILLDNMSPEMVRKAVQRAGSDVYLEASGGITLANVKLYAQTGVHGISIGALTHSIEAIDISLNI